LRTTNQITDYLEQIEEQEAMDDSDAQWMTVMQIQTTTPTATAAAAAAATAAAAVTKMQRWRRQKSTEGRRRDQRFVSTCSLLLRKLAVAPTEIQV